MALAQSHNLGSLCDGKLVFQNAVEHLDPGLFLLIQCQIPHGVTFSLTNQLAGDIIVDQQHTIARTYGPVVARVIEPPCGPVDGLLSPFGLRVNHLLSVEQGPVRGRAFAVAGAFYDDLVAGVGEPVEGAVAQDGVVEESEPLPVG